MKQLHLQSIPGVEQKRARPPNLQWCLVALNYQGAPKQCSFCANVFPGTENKVMRQYVVDCETLRKRYNIEETAGPIAGPEEQPAAIIDCVAEVECFWRNSCDSATAEHQSPEESPEEPAVEQMEEAAAAVGRAAPPSDAGWEEEMQLERDLETEELGPSQAASIDSAAVLPDHLTAQPTPGFRVVVGDMPVVGG